MFVSGVLVAGVFGVVCVFGVMCLRRTCLRSSFLWAVFGDHVFLSNHSSMIIQEPIFNVTQWKVKYLHAVYKQRN